MSLNKKLLKKALIIGGAVAALAVGIAIAALAGRASPSGGIFMAEPEYAVGYTGLQLYDDAHFTWAQAMVQVTNTGRGNLLLAPGVFYFTDSQSGAAVFRRDEIQAYPPILAPGETGYYYFHEIVFDLNAASDFELEYEIDVARPDSRGPQVTAAFGEITETEHGIGIAGEISNTTNRALSSVSTAVVLYDHDDTPLAIVRSTIQDDIEPGETRAFVVGLWGLPPGVNAEKIERYIGKVTGVEVLENA